MALYYLLAGLAIISTISYSRGLSCASCVETVCDSPDNPTDCTTRFVECDDPAPDCIEPKTPVCQCCPVCAALEGEECGKWSRHCASGLVCVRPGHYDGFNPYSRLTIFNPFSGGKCTSSYG